MLIEMKLKGLTMDPLTSAPIVILKDNREERILPIWIAIPEANAIMMELDKVQIPRPMTHDLFKHVIEKLSGTIVRIIVNDLRDNTFFAIIELEQAGKTILVDARPSDAIAMALRFNVPIFVESSVLEKSSISNPPSATDQDEAEQLRNWLESLKPEDFGKYKM